MGGLFERYGTYSIIPNAFWDGNVNPAKIAVFAYLRYCINVSRGDETAWPKYETIMAACGIGSRKTLARVLRELEADHWITRRRRYSNSTVYDLHTAAEREAAQREALVAHAATSTTTEAAPITHAAHTVALEPGPDITESAAAPQEWPTDTTAAAAISSAKELSVVPKMAHQLDELNKTKDIYIGARQKNRGTEPLTAHDDPRVAAYLSTVKPEITQSNAALIMGRVTLDGIAVWQAVLTMLATKFYRPDNFEKMLERYAAELRAASLRAGSSPQAAQRKPYNAFKAAAGRLPQAEEKTGAELEASRARARAQREARRRQRVLVDEVVN